MTFWNHSPRLGTFSLQVAISWRRRESNPRNVPAARRGRAAGRARQLVDAYREADPVSRQLSHFKRGPTVVPALFSGLNSV